MSDDEDPWTEQESSRPVSVRAAPPPPPVPPSRPPGPAPSPKRGQVEDPAVQLTTMSDDEGGEGAERDDTSHPSAVINILHSAPQANHIAPPPPHIPIEDREETNGSAGRILPPTPAPHYPPATPTPPPSKSNYPAPKGLNNIVKNTSELPLDVQQRVFLQDECVLGEFDSLTTENTLVSPRLHIYLSIFTLGLYDVMLFLIYVYKFVKHVVCCCECAREEVFYNRHKLTITNKGRALFWQLRVLQKNKIDQQTHHTIVSSLQVHKIEDISQISVHYSDQYHCMHCLCHDYISGVHVTFNAFTHENTQNKASHVYIHTIQNYIQLINNYLYDTFVSRTSNIHTHASSHPITYKLVSNPHSAIYADEGGGQESWEDVNKLHKAINQVLTNIRTGSSVSIHGADMSKNVQLHSQRSSLYTKKHDSQHTKSRHQSDASDASTHNGKAPLLYKPVFLTAKDLRTEEFIKKFGDVGDDSQNILPGVKELHTSWTGFVLCEEDGYVNVPLQYVNLHPEEEIIAAVGMPYVWTVYDYITYFLTLGIFKFTLWHKRVYSTSALILTSHRLVEMLINHPKGKIPAELSNIDIDVYCYYPKHVYAGAMKTIQKGTFVDSSIYTSHGCISVTIPSTHLQFAQRMQMTYSRMRGLPYATFPDLESHFLPDLGFMMNRPEEEGGVTDKRSKNDMGMFYETQNPIAGGKADSEQQATQETGPEGRLTCKFSKLDKLLLPLLPNESIMFKYFSGPIYTPYGLVQWTRYAYTYLCGFFRYTPNHAHSNNNIIYTCFQLPSWLSCLTCGKYPTHTTQYATMTSHTFYYTTCTHPKDTQILSKKDIGYTNIPKTMCGCASKSTLILDEFSVVWVPIRSLHNYSLDTYNRGTKPYTQSILCCRIHTKSHAAQYVLHVNTTLGLVFPFSEDVRFKMWNRDVHLTRFI
eukprot:gene33541-40576_t